MNDLSFSVRIHYHLWQRFNAMILVWCSWLCLNKRISDLNEVLHALQPNVSFILVCWTKCRLRFDELLKLRLHSSQTCDLPFIWITFWCLNKFSACGKVLWHLSHSYGFSAEWVPKWYKRFRLQANFLPHSSHECDRIPSWTLFLWTFRLFNKLNVLWHTSHACGFSPVCVRACNLSKAAVPNFLPHSTHSNDWISWWTQILCDFNWVDWENDKSHSSHAYGCVPKTEKKF